jgi:hypothetical protein
MSDIQELIHRQGVISFNTGVRTERERIVKLLEDEELQADLNNSMKHYDQLVWLGIKEQLITLIKGQDA